jgi:acyl dehydratase
MFDTEVSMTVNPDVIGQVFDPHTFEYDRKAVMLYALGVGAGTDELDFIYEKNLEVLPTFVTVPFFEMWIDNVVPGMNLDRSSVHGEHEITLHRPIPTSGAMVSVPRCESIYDKGDRGAVVNISFEIRDRDDEPIATCRAVIFDPKGGNFGGERGPKAEPARIPEDVEPDFRMSETIPLNQAALYRLSGDYNPLHIDPEFAKMVGFPQPIVHGLCTFGYAGRAFVRQVCDKRPERLRSIGLRFSSAVYPGDTITTEAWRIEDGRYHFRTVNQDGVPVLSNGVAVVE